MKSKIIAAIALLFITTNLTTQAQGPAPGPATHFAERTYGEYATATGGKVSFNVQTLSQGPLSDLAGKPFSAFLVVPTYRVESDQDGIELTNVGFIDSVESDWEHQEFNSLPDRFQDVGLPLQMGVYRRLGITATIGADSRSYESMEFCWASLSQCKMLDPVVVFLQSKVDNRMQLIADGWGKKVSIKPATAGSCVLQSNPSVSSQTFTWPTRTKMYKDSFGRTVVQETLGTQSVTISCDTSCLPHPSASSSPSSGTGFFGWSVRCSNKSATGTTGSTATAI
ncbi:MAG TPA: hypothetical protein VFF39_09455, partial [Verrucomicrobiae bacterium]|nr:hypothetical protein [Verrucomicrobiae bacterium]